MSALAVKYLYKYVYKGPDVVSWVMKDDAPKAPIKDEIALFQSARFITAHDALWKIYGYPMDMRRPSVERLDIHDESKENENTTLTAFFDRVKLELVSPLSEAELGYSTTGDGTYPPITELTYSQVPIHYVLKRDERGHISWIRRKKYSGLPKIGRIFMRQGFNNTHYYRHLLLHRKGPTSFMDLRTVRGVTYADPKDACIEMGLFHDPRYFEEMFKEMSFHLTPEDMRKVFANVLLNVEYLPSALHIWVTFKKDFSIDYYRRRVSGYRIRPDFEDVDYQHALLDINTELTRVNPSRGTTFYGLPDVIIKNLDTDDLESLNIEEFRQEVDSNLDSMNEDQLVFFNEVRKCRLTLFITYN